jgi:hypothetical protein
MTELKRFPDNSPADSADPEQENVRPGDIQDNPEAGLLEKWLKLAEAALKKNQEDKQSAD